MWRNIVVIGLILILVTMMGGCTQTFTRDPNISMNQQFSVGDLEYTITYAQWKPGTFGGEDYYWGGTVSNKGNHEITQEISIQKYIMQNGYEYKPYNMRPYTGTSISVNPGKSSTFSFFGYGIDPDFKPVAKIYFTIEGQQYIANV